MNENCFFHVSHSLHIFNCGKVLPLESNISEIKLRKNDLKFNFLKQCFHNAKIIVACSWKEKSVHHCRKNISVNKNMRWMEIYRADGFIYICCADAVNTAAADGAVKGVKRCSGKRGFSLYNSLGAEPQLPI